MTIPFMLDKTIILIEEYGLKMEYEPNGTTESTTLTSCFLTLCLWDDFHQRIPKSIQSCFCLPKNMEKSH